MISGDGNLEPAGGVDVLDNQAFRLEVVKNGMVVVHDKCTDQKVGGVFPGIILTPDAAELLIHGLLQVVEQAREIYIPSSKGGPS